MIPREGVESAVPKCISSNISRPVIPREGVESQKAVPRRMFYFNVE